MNLISKINIQNYRGFEKLDINGLNQINLFIGRNNSGKSSILEAIFLILGISNPLLLETIHKLRGLNIQNAEELKYFFHNLNFSNTPKIECFFTDLSTRKLELDPRYNSSSLQDLLDKNNKIEIPSTSSTTTLKVTGLDLNFSTKKVHDPIKKFKSSLVFGASEINRDVDKSYKEELYGIFISGNSGEANALLRYAEILKRKKGDSILDALKKIDPNIESITPLPDGLYFGYRNIAELVPTNIAGDGIRRILNILTSIFEKNNSFVLIDEIENGLHYSAYKTLWQNMLTFSNEVDSQLFISTHSIETLKCLKELLEDSNYQKFQDKVNIYSVINTKNQGVKTFKYSYEGLKDAIETETEIR
ncbi:MAG: AAA family ATPase [Bacteroidetes bacterium]|nr:AAA family ATPase [Bacteroidota bacterium]